MSRFLGTVLGVVLLVTGGCDLLDPTRPTTHADTEVFGNLLEVIQGTEDPIEWTARIAVRPPRALVAAEQASGRPTPVVEEGLVATVTVSSDTVVIVGDRPAALTEIPPGTEVVVLPIQGTTQMIGSDDVRVDAEMFMDFSTYGQWRLPGLAATEGTDAEDPERINSSAAELAPVPLDGGNILYFSSRLRAPVSAEDRWHGAVREGLEIPGEGLRSRERTYRTELSPEGWSRPQLVRFQGLDEADQLRVTWVSADETRCLVTVAEGGAPPRVGMAMRSRGADSWRAPEMIEELGENAHDAVFLTGSTSQMVYVSGRGGAPADIFLFNPKDERSPLPLEPPISTLGNEWNPRTGPQNELFFCREDRQLVFVSKRVRALRLPGPHRAVFTRAAPTDDRQWLFFCMPSYQPGETDENIFVARWQKDFRLGEPVPVDAWRP
jgi:hypothetical protein